MTWLRFQYLVALAAQCHIGPRDIDRVTVREFAVLIDSIDKAGEG